MRRLPLLLTLATALGACVSPETAPLDPAAPVGTEQSFSDVTAWTDRVRGATSDDELIAFSTELSAAADWPAACEDDDPTAYRRGIVRVVDLDGERTLAEVTCQTYAYQSTFVLVATPDDQPHVVRALRVVEDGTVSTDTLAHFVGYLYHDETAPSDGFGIVSKSAGHGGCGTDVTYRLQADGTADIDEVRAWPDCEDPVAADEWPVTYPTN